MPAATNTQATIGYLLLLCNAAVNIIEEAVFSMGPSRDYISSTKQNQIRMRIEGVQRSITEYNGVLEELSLVQFSSVGSQNSSCGVSIQKKMTVC
jgi:hypothetical protein